MVYDLVKAVTVDILVNITSKAVSVLCDCIKKIVSRIKSFKSRLAKLLNLIESVNLFLERIEQCQQCSFKYTAERLKNEIKRAEKFAGKCLKVAWWNCYKKFMYAQEIETLNDSLSHLLGEVKSDFETINQQRRIDAMNEKLDRLVLALGNKSDAGVISRIMGIFESVAQKINHQLTSIAERRFSKNAYHRLSITN